MPFDIGCHSHQRVDDVASDIWRALACGTVDYLAPEIVRQQGHGFEVDLWALGVLAFEMLLGFAPFAGVMVGDDDTTTYKNILSGNFRIPPGALTPEAFSFVYGLLTAGPRAATSCLPRYQTHSET